jgi:hypothetical protein
VLLTDIKREREAHQEEDEKMLNKCNPYHDKGIMINNIPFSRKEVSTFLALSAAIALLLSSPLVLFNLLLQPVQAQSSVTFRTTEPSRGNDVCTSNTAMITFDAHGTPSSSNPQFVDITGGTFRITSIHDGQTLYSGNIYGGKYISTSGGGNVGMSAQANDVTNNTSSCISSGEDISILTSCSTSDTNSIDVYTPNRYELASFEGAVECSSQGDTQSSSSSTTGGSQDGDGDGILDANDNCPNLPNTRCYKEDTTRIIVHNNR